MTRERAIGVACGAGLLVIWAGFHLMSRLGGTQGIGSWDLALLRFAGAFVALLPVALWRGLPRIAPHRVAVVLVLAGFGFPLFAYAGYRLAPAAHGATMMAAGLPVVTSLLAAALGIAAITGRRALSLAVVVAGSVLLAVATSGVYASAWRGDLLFLGGVSCWAVYTLLVQRWRLDAIDATVAIGLLALPVYLPLWWWLAPPGLAAIPTATLLTQAAFHGVAGVAVAGILYTRAVTALGPGPTTLIGALVPAIAATAAWPLLNEALPPLGILAIVLACSGMVLGVRDRGPAR